MEIVFATHNLNKLKEVQDMVPSNIKILGLNDINCHEEIIEDGSTLTENAQIKADFVFENYGMSCFADDTGLEVEALQGEPGVFSARYAGEEKNSEANMQKILNNLVGKSNRKAHFKTIICYKTPTENLFFEGLCKGEILTEKQGEKGFGYDPIFKPDESELSFAEMLSTKKNEISHRGRAFAKFYEYLKSNG
nr:non-canonical purine NTP diphosphatase [Psychroflexus salis]